MLGVYQGGVPRRVYQGGVPRRVYQEDTPVGVPGYTTLGMYTSLYHPGMYTPIPPGYTPHIPTLPYPVPR